MPATNSACSMTYRPVTPRNVGTSDKAARTMLLEVTTTTAGISVTSDRIMNAASSPTAYRPHHEGGQGHQKPHPRLQMRLGPAAEEHDGRHPCHPKHFAVLTQLEQREPHARVLREIPRDQFRLSLRQIKRDAVDLGRGGGQ